MFSKRFQISWWLPASEIDSLGVDLKEKHKTRLKTCTAIALGKQTPLCFPLASRPRLRMDSEPSRVHIELGADPLLLSAAFC